MLSFGGGTFVLFKGEEGVGNGGVVWVKDGRVKFKETVPLRGSCFLFMCV